EIWTIVENLDKQVEFHLDDDHVLWQDTWLVVPNDASVTPPKMRVATEYCTGALLHNITATDT
nr:hypothetical protein [Tanacetum cinerariifolium]